MGTGACRMIFLAIAAVIGTGLTAAGVREIRAGQRRAEGYAEEMTQ